MLFRAGATVLRPVILLWPAFACAISVTVTTSPPGLSTTVDGTTANSPRVFDWLSGSQHQISVPTPQGNSADRYVFKTWSNGAPLQQTYTVSATQTLTATMELQHQIVMTVNPPGAGNAIGAGWWPDGFPATVAASPNPGFVFNSLSGDVTSTYNWAKQNLTKALNVTANFIARTPNAHQIWIIPTGVTGSGAGTQANPYQTPDAHSFDAVMRTVPDDSQINLLPGVFLTYGANENYGNCQSQGEPGWNVGKRWNLVGSGRDVTTIRLYTLCQPLSQTVGHPLHVIGTPYYQDNSDSIVSDLTVDGNYQAFGNEIFDWMINIGAVNLQGSRCTIRNVKAINHYGWFVDPRAPGKQNLAEDFAIVIATFHSFTDNIWERTTGNLIENSELSASAGNYIDAMQIFSAPNNQPGTPSFTDETDAGLPGHIIRNNLVKDLTGPSAYGGTGKGLVVDSNTTNNVNNAIRSDTRWVLDMSVTNNQFLNILSSGITLSGDLDARFRRDVFARNILGATNSLGSTYSIFFKQSNSNPVEDLLVYNNQFQFTESGTGYVPSAIVLEGLTRGPQNIRMIDNVLDPIYLQRGKNCPTADEPICQAGTVTPTYQGIGNLTTAGVPIAKLNATIPAPPAPPSAYSATGIIVDSPNQTAVLEYWSPSGYSYITDAYVLFNSSLNAANACSIFYDRGTNAFYLFNNSASAVTGPLSPGSNWILQNSQCTLNGVGTSVSGAADTLTLALNLTFTGSFGFAQTIFMYAADAGGMSSGWQTKGTTASNTPPTADSVTPNMGSGTSQNFTFKYSSVNGYKYLTTAYALINGSLSGSGGCLAYYLPSSNALYLFNDAGTGLTGPITPGGTGTLTNNQCTINGPTSSVSGAVNQLSLTLAVAFKPAVGGTQTVFGYAADNAGFASGWQTLGSWTPHTISNTPPTADSVTPNAGSGTSQNFTFKYSSVNGFGYLNTMYALINGSLNAANGCAALYLAGSNALYLFNDAGSGLSGPITPGGAGTLTNSQCSIDGPTSSVTGAVNQLSLTLAVTFKPAFNGTQTVFGYATDNGNLTSGWQTLGSWTSGTVVNTPPTVDSVTPNAGSGIAQSFTFKYSSVNGFSYLNTMYALINGSLSPANGCLAYYQRGSNALYLFNDAGNGLVGPITPGGAGTLSNTQCTINGPTSSVNGAVNQLSLTLAVTFKAAFNAVQTLFGYTADNGNLTSGWKTLGTWTSH